MPAITETDRFGLSLRGAAPIAASAALLLWPAAWNGYPLVFSDTGTYLSQAAAGYVGWDRPPFYSLAILPLHLALTTWPVVIVQALAVAAAVHGLCAPLPSTSPWRPTAIVAVLALLTPLPFFASQLMPDVFTGLVVLAIARAFALPRSRAYPPRTKVLFVAVTTALIACHLSHLLLATSLVLALGIALRPGWRRIALASLPIALAALACVTVNTVAHGRVAIAPYSDVFLLARLLADGPAARTLARDCPHERWRVCAALAAPPKDADDFLWRSDGVLASAGGAKAVAPEASTIVRRTVAAEPLATAASALRNSATQLGMFETGDGLNAWPDGVTPWMVRIFPASEVAAYGEARQQQGTLTVPRWMIALHFAAALTGIFGCIAAMLRGPRPLAIVAAAVLLALPVNACVTGALSGPHHRYQARIVWLPLAVSLAAAPFGARHPAITAGAEALAP